MSGPTLTVNQAGNPFVEVFVEDFPAGTSTLRIERLSEDRTWTVRGGVSVAAGVAVVDFEVPFCVPVSYRAECFDGSGLSLGFTDSSSVTVWEDRAVAHQPLVPQMWSNVVLAEGTFETVERPSSGEVVWVQGATVGRVIGSGRRGVVETPIRLEAARLSDASDFQAMLGTYEVRQLPVLCVRTPPNVPLDVPRTFFTHIPKVTSRDFNVRWGGTVTHLEFMATEVEPPFPGLTTPLLSYDDIDAAYGSYDLADAAYPSYTDRDRDYSLAGSS
jgi:hypothetical protein